MKTDKMAKRSGGLAGLRVLIAEDRGLIATKILHTLRSAGCVPIGPANSLASAAVLLQGEGEKIGAAVLDIDLRGQPVYPFAKTLRERGVPIIFVTGYGQNAIPNEWRATHRLEKPFEPATLIACLEEACRGRPARMTSNSTHVTSESIARANETVRAARNVITEVRITLEQSRADRDD